MTISCDFVELERFLELDSRFFEIVFDRLQAVPLQSVESKLGRTGEGEMSYFLPFH